MPWICQRNAEDREGVSIADLNMDKRHCYRSPLPTPHGVVLFRLAGTTADQDNRKIIEVLESRTDWAGHFAMALSIVS